MHLSYSPFSPFSYFPGFELTLTVYLSKLPDILEDNAGECYWHSVKSNKIVSGSNVFRSFQGKMLNSPAVSLETSGSCVPHLLEKLYPFPILRSTASVLDLTVQQTPSFHWRQSPVAPLMPNHKHVDKFD